jgi:hypothetical protein
MTYINIEINAQDLVNDVVNLIDIADLANDVFDQIDLDEVANKAIQRIDTDEIASEVIDNIDMESLAERVVGYIDYTELAQEIDISNQMDNYLSMGSLVDLSFDYDPTNGCTLGKNVTNIISTGFNYLVQKDMDSLDIDGIEMKDTVILNTIIKCVEKYSSLVAKEEEPKLEINEALVTVQPEEETVSEFKVTLTYNQLNTVVEKFVLNYNLLFNISQGMEWNQYFKESVGSILTMCKIDFEIDDLNEAKGD